MFNQIKESIESRIHGSKESILSSRPSDSFTALKPFAFSECPHLQNNFTQLKNAGLERQTFANNASVCKEDNRFKLNSYYNIEISALMHFI